MKILIVKNAFAAKAKIMAAILAAGHEVLEVELCEVRLAENGIAVMGLEDFKLVEHGDDSSVPVSVPVVVITDYLKGGDADVFRAWALGASFVMTDDAITPIRKEELINVISRLIYAYYPEKEG